MAVSIFGGEQPTVKTNYFCHEGQAEVSKALKANFCSLTPASIIEIIASRGWGKTLYMVCEILAPYLDTHPNRSVMWVAPTYLIAQSPVDDVFNGTNEETGEKYIPQYDEKGRKVWEFATTRSGPILKWWTGATVVFRSADSPDSIVSKGYNLIIIDEACLIQEEVYTLQIMGTARKKGIKIFMISSPRGKKHWTYKIFLQGQDPSETDYLSFKQPWWKNPFFSPILKRLMKFLPDWVKRQEYDAEFIDDGDSIFKNLDNNFYGNEITYESSQQEWSQPITDIKVSDKVTGETKLIKAADRTFITSMDLAKSSDFTVITVLDMESGDLVYYRRLNKEDYRKVLKIAETVCKTHNNCDLIFDATGVGQGLGDVLNNYDITTHPFVFTNDSKVEIINKLILSLEYQELKLPNIQEIRKELFGNDSKR